MGGLEVAAGVELRAPVEGRDAEILSADALAFVAELHRRFDGTRRELLAARVERQARIDAGELPDFLPETREIRESEWRVAPVPADLQDRRVEITGPVDRKMVINALNSGAPLFMADFEDANTPTWRNNLDGQANLHRRDRADDRARHRREELSPERRPGRASRAPARVAPRRAPRARGRRRGVREPLRLRALPLPQRQAPARQGQRARTSTCRSWKATSRPGSGTTSSTSRRRSSACRAGAIRATVLIETILAAFEMDEILLRAPRARGRAERGPLGLHLQHHQEVPRRTRSSCCPIARR